jgi:hypothetical protein
MEQRKLTGSTGYLVVLLGAAAFVTGLFLPYFDYRPIAGRAMSLYRLTMLSPGDPATNWGGGLFLFAGVATLAWIAIAGIRGSGGWTRSALAAVTIVWSLTWLGVLLGASLFVVSRAVGYWVLLLSLGVVVIGAISVWVSARAEVAKDDAPAS